MKSSIVFSDIAEGNGKTIRQNNLDKKHNIPIGTIVEVEIEESDSDRHGMFLELKGKCRLYVVGHTRDCDGTPLYELSTSKVALPSHLESF